VLGANFTRSSSTTTASTATPLELAHVIVPLLHPSRSRASRASPNLSRVSFIHSSLERVVSLVLSLVLSLGRATPNRIRFCFS